MFYFTPCPVPSCPAYEPNSIDGEYSQRFRHIQYKRTPNLRPIATSAMLLCRRMELKEKKARVEDAMHATRAAVEEGIVAGGGTAYLRCIPVLEKLKLHDDEATGVNIVRRALEDPIRQIAQNAGHEGALIVGRVRESKDENFGFNAETGEFEDMIKAGVIDPAKVTRLALQNAASVVSLMLTTEVLIADLKDEEQPAAAGAGMGGGY